MLEVSRDAVTAGVEKKRQLFSGLELVLLYLYSNPWPFRRFTFHVLGSLAVSSRRRWRFERLFCHLRLRH
jgi:hypothetical protein